MALQSLSVSHLHVPPMAVPQISTSSTTGPVESYRFPISDILTGLILYSELISNNVSTSCSFVGGS